MNRFEAVTYLPITNIWILKCICGRSIATSVIASKECKEPIYSQYTYFPDNGNITVS